MPGVCTRGRLIFAGTIFSPLLDVLGDRLMHRAITERDNSLGKIAILATDSGVTYGDDISFARKQDASLLSAIKIDISAKRELKNRMHIVRIMLIRIMIII